MAPKQIRTTDAGPVHSAMTPFAPLSVSILAVAAPKPAPRPLTCNVLSLISIAFRALLTLDSIAGRNGCALPVFPTLSFIPPARILTQKSLLPSCPENFGDGGRRQEMARSGFSDDSECAKSENRGAAEYSVVLRRLAPFHAFSQLGGARVHAPNGHRNP